jgi:hypothetical protein
MLRFYEVFKVIFLKVFSAGSRQANDKRGRFRRGSNMRLEIDSEVLGTYAAANGLDQIQELWNVLWGIPAVRCCLLTAARG